VLTKTFYRGTGYPIALGSDVDPSTLSVPASMVYLSQDNTIPIPPRNITGVPDAPIPPSLVILLSYAGVGSPVATTAAVYIYEPLVQQWFPVQTDVAITWGQENFVNIEASVKGDTFAVVLSATSPPAGVYSVSLGFNYLPTSAQDSTLTSGAAKTQIVNAAGTVIGVPGHPVAVDGSAVTQPISATSLPLPTGASQDATLTSGIQKTQIVDGTDTTIGVSGHPFFMSWPVASSVSELGDITVTTSAASLGSLASGPTGILVTAHPNNSVNIRIGANPTSSKGQPLAPGASFVWSVTNANVLKAIAEGSGTATLCVSAV
jgi:hypothetical protein